MKLTQVLSSAFSYADVYRHRNSPSIPGTIQICCGDGPNIICIFAQYGPGRAKPGDTKEDRISWFETCLIEILSKGITKVAMPYNIGCGLAGGDWKVYHELLEKTELEIVLYKL